MNYLFNSTIVDRGEIVKYRVYGFNLYPGKYKAELATPYVDSYIKEVVFWKAGNKWETEPPTENAARLVKAIAPDIDKLKH
jgi:hypothetical protein